jgi:hypothetical protein
MSHEELTSVLSRRRTLAGRYDSHNIGITSGLCLAQIAA